MRLKKPSKSDIIRKKQDMDKFLSRNDVQQCINRLRRKYAKGELKNVKGTRKEMEEAEKAWAKEINWVLDELKLHEGWYMFFRSDAFNLSMVKDFHYDPDTPIYKYADGKVFDIKTFPGTTDRDTDNTKAFRKQGRIETTTQKKVALYKIASALQAAGKEVYVEDLQRHWSNQFPSPKLTISDIKTTLSRYQDELGIMKKYKIPIRAKSKSKNYKRFK